jgi:conjugative relaxase-like TrwC/TraI family protein
VLNITPLRDAEYLISSVALGIDEYYLGVGEAPGVWQGRWAADLGLAGVVEADQLRALVEGVHPVTGVDLLEGNRKRETFAFDATYSCPKSVSLLWAFATPETATVVSRAHTEAVATALAFLEDKAAFARRQEGGVRRRVGTHGFAVATFFHRTSREGDPQLHTHCLIPNVVARADGTHVAFNAHPLHEWKKASGSLFQSELRRLLSRDLGVEWGPDRHGCREMVGFSREQLRTFSKRTAQIEAELEARGGEYESAAARMRANDAASLATRRPKDRQLTPTLLAEAWRAEARTVGLEGPAQVESLVVGRGVGFSPIDRHEVFAHLVDPDVGVCARRARFTEAHVYEAVCALSDGRWDAGQIAELASAFLASPHAVRLAPAVGAEWCESARWSTAEHRALEDHVLGRLEQLARRPDDGVRPEVVQASLGREPALGDDQADAVRELCAPGPALRALIAPAGHGKTTAVHAAAVAQNEAGRRVLGLGATNKAVEELRAVGMEAMTIARLRTQLGDRGLAPGTLLVVDEVSKVSTRDAAVVLDAAAVTPGAGVWFLGDPRQGTPVAAGGIAAEVARMGAAGLIPAPELTENRRQRDEADRVALARLREGRAPESQTMRASHGWEHEQESPEGTREALADAVAADVERFGPDAVVALAVSHADCEDIADRVRRRLIAIGHVAEGGATGPGWGLGERTYAAGDRVLLHARFRNEGGVLHNGSVGTVTAAADDGALRVRFEQREVLLPGAFVAGLRDNATPNLSHAWARTVDGAQGGTWEAAHLLGTDALDALRAYVGQSRSRVPTHTWNVRRTPALDHGGVLADDRDGAAQVLAAMGRQPEVDFAAADDPWPADRRLRAERAEHRHVLDRCPKNRSRELQQAVNGGHPAGLRLRAAKGDVERAVQALKELPHLARITAAGRASRSRAEAHLAEATGALDRRRAEVLEADHRVAELKAHQRDREEFLAREGWRSERLVAIDDELARHWAPVVLAATRQDDPLAFGLDSLRAARATYGTQLGDLVRSFPPDRAEALDRAQVESARARGAVSEARVAASAAAGALDDARRRHWGRRDRDAVDSATRRSEQAAARLSVAIDHETKSRRVVKTEVAGQRARLQALRDNRAVLADLEQSVADVERALERVRTDRVIAMERGDAPRSHVVGMLGEPPSSFTGRQAWCALAYEIETYRDHHPNAVGHEHEHGAQAAIGPAPSSLSDRISWDHLTRRIADGAAIVAVADALPVEEQLGLGGPERWSERLDDAFEVWGAAVALERDAPSLGIDL